MLDSLAPSRGSTIDRDDKYAKSDQQTTVRWKLIIGVGVMIIFICTWWSLHLDRTTTTFNYSSGRGTTGGGVDESVAVHRRPTNSLIRSIFTPPTDADPITPTTTSETSKSSLSPSEQNVDVVAMSRTAFLKRAETWAEAAGNEPTAASKLLLLTYATHAGFKFCDLLASCRMSQLPLVALGWKTEHKGLGYKVLTTRDYLSTIDPGTVILFVDAFDVLITQPAEYILKEFLKFNTTLLFMGEKGCWPYLDSRPKGEELCNFYYPDAVGNSPYRFVNTGSWIGYAGAALRLLAAIEDAHKNEEIGNLNDQELITDFYVCDHLRSLYASGGEAAVVKRVGHVFGDTTALAGAKRIGGCTTLEGGPRFGITLDTSNIIFQSLHNSEVDQHINAEQRWDIHVEWDEQVQRWRNLFSRQYPAVFHFNGGGKKHVDLIWNKVLTAHQRQQKENPSRATPTIDESTKPLLTSYQTATKKYVKLDEHEICPK